MRQLLQELSHQGLHYLQVDCATSALHSSDCTAKYLYTVKIYAIIQEGMGKEGEMYFKISKGLSFDLSDRPIMILVLVFELQ